MLSILKHHFFQYPDDKLVMTQERKNGNALEDYQDLFEKAITKNARIIFYLFSNQHPRTNEGAERTSKERQMLILMVS